MTGNGRQLLAKLNFCVQDSEQTNQKVPVLCQLDTGASCNVISYRDLAILMQVGEPPLERSQVKLKMFDGSTLKPIGETRLRVEHREKQQSLKFQVVAESANKPLLSAEACEDLQSWPKVHGTPKKIHIYLDYQPGTTTKLLFLNLEPSPPPPEQCCLMQMYE